MRKKVQHGFCVGKTMYGWRQQPRGITPNKQCGLNKGTEVISCYNSAIASDSYGGDMHRRAQCRPYVSYSSS